MPRPKVHPSQRQRAAEACNFCRVSKKRCSATVPCNHCTRRGIANSCYLTYRPRGSRGDPVIPSDPTSTSAAKVGPVLDEQGQHSATFGQQPPLQSDGQWSLPEEDANAPVSPPDSRLETQSNAASSNIEHRQPLQSPLSPTSPSVTREPHPRMLLNSRGERGMSLF